MGQLEPQYGTPDCQWRTVVLEYFSSENRLYTYIKKTTFNQEGRSKKEECAMHTSNVCRYRVKSLCVHTKQETRNMWYLVMERFQRHVGVEIALFGIYNTPGFFTNSLSLYGLPASGE